MTRTPFAPNGRGFPARATGNYCRTASLILFVAFQLHLHLPMPVRAADFVAFDRERDDELPSLWTRETGVDWPGFLGPTGDNKSPEKGLIVPWPQAGPRIVWQREIGTSYDIGSVSRGRYFQFDRHRDQARLTCHHAETGEPIWKFDYPTDYVDAYGYNGGPRCSPVIDGNRVYIYGVEGMLHCLRATDGRKIWRVDTQEKFGVVQNFFGVGSTPVVFGDLLLVMIGGSPAADRRRGTAGLDQVRPNGTAVVAFDKFTGEVKYQLGDDLASYASLKLATIGERSWCFAFCRGGLLGFDPRTGNVDFHYPWRADMLESVNASTPVVVGDEVLISETYQIGASLLKVRPGGHDVVWRDQRRSRNASLKTHWNTPIQVDGYLYACSGRNEPDADLRCIDWQTGKVQWIHDPGLESRERSSLLYVDGHFIYLGEFGELQLLRVNPKKYELVSKVMLARQTPKDDFKFRPLPLLAPPCWAAPILSHGLMYVRGKDRVVCLEVIAK